MDAMIRYYDTYTEPMIIKKNNLIPWHKYQMDKFVTMTGSNIISAETGAKLIEFEYAKDEIHSVGWACRRQLGSR